MLIRSNGPVSDDYRSWQFQSCLLWREQNVMALYRRPTEYSSKSFEKSPYYKPKRESTKARISINHYRKENLVKLTKHVENWDSLAESRRPASVHRHRFTKQTERNSFSSRRSIFTSLSAVKVYQGLAV